MPSEFGIYSDEGLLEDDFWSREEAEKAAAERYPRDGVTIRVVDEDEDE